MPAKRALSAALALMLAVGFVTPSGARALSTDGFEYFDNGSGATVTGCTSTCPVNLVIPATLGGFAVTSIKDSAFTTNLLTAVTIPDSVTTISDYAFETNLLTAVTIPDSVTTIGVYAFASNLLTAVTIPDSVTTIGDAAFAYNLLTAVTIPNSVTTIGSSVFYSNLLTAVTIPDSVTSIGDYAFETNLLTSVTFLGNAPTEGDEVFKNNGGLAAVTRLYAATGWGSTWSGKPVVIADLPLTNREGSVWTVTLVILAGLTAAASIGLRVRGAKRA